MELKNKKAIFLGDSITAGVGTSSPDRVYYQVLKEKEDLSEVVGYGVSGTRFARQDHEVWSDGMNEDFCRRMERMDPDADIVVVFGGSNDFGHGEAPIGTPSDRTPMTFWGACHYLMSGLMKKYPKATIVVMSPLHRLNENDPHGDGVKGDVTGTLNDYRKIMMEVAEYYSLPVLDLFRVSGIQPQIPENRELYLPDGLHPSDLGNERIARLLANFLKQL